MKYLLAVLPFALLPAIYPASSLQGSAPPAAARIGYVNAQRILSESAAGKAEVTRMQTMQQQKTTELRGKQQTLEATRQQLSQGGDSATRDRLQQQEQQQRTDLERATVQAQTEFQTVQRQALADFQAKVRPVVEQVAKSENVQLVLNGDAAVVWAAPGFDLTQLVIDRLNAKP
jgi:Skp family chaperone for outer membrane proteins